MLSLGLPGRIKGRRAGRQAVGRTGRFYVSYVHWCCGGERHLDRSQVTTLRGAVTEGGLGCFGARESSPAYGFTNRRLGCLAARIEEGLFLRSGVSARAGLVGAKALSGNTRGLLAESRFTPRLGDVLSVSSRRDTSKDRSLENTGCARASVISAEVVTGVSWLGCARGYYAFAPLLA
jgi:hypothetical protein